MGYKCVIDQEHYDGPPVKVVTKQRPVTYLNDTGITHGLETVEEVFIHPSNADVLGEPQLIEAQAKVVDCQRKKKRREAPEAEPSYITTWNEVKHERHLQ